MKAIAENPDPTSSFLNHNKHFLKNNKVGSDHATHNLIVNMFEAYIKSKVSNLDLGNRQKGILKPFKNNVRFESLGRRHSSDHEGLAYRMSQEMNKARRNGITIPETETDNKENSFYAERLEFESNV